MDPHLSVWVRARGFLSGKGSFLAHTLWLTYTQGTAMDSLHNHILESGSHMATCFSNISVIVVSRQLTLSPTHSVINKMSVRLAFSPVAKGSIWSSVLLIIMKNLDIRCQCLSMHYSEHSSNWTKLKQSCPQEFQKVEKFSLGRSCMTKMEPITEILSEIFMRKDPYSGHFEVNNFLQRF